VGWSWKSYIENMNEVLPEAWPPLCDMRLRLVGDRSEGLGLVLSQ